MVLPAEPAAPAKEPCSGLVVRCTQIFAQEDLWSQLAKEGRSLGCLCVSGHFPGSPCLSDMLLGRAVHCLGALQASLSSCPGHAVTPSFSQRFWRAPLDPPVRAPSPNTRGGHTARRTGEEGGEDGAHSSVSPPDTPPAPQGGGAGARGAVAPVQRVTWGRAVGFHVANSVGISARRSRGLGAVFSGREGTNPARCFCKRPLPRSVAASICGAPGGWGGMGGSRHA